MPLILLPTACAAAAAAVAPASALAAFSRPKPSRIRASHLLFAFPRLRKYGRRDREPVTTSFDEEEAEEDEEYGEEVEEDAWLEKRPKPVGFGAGRTYSTDIEERLLQEMGLGGARRRSEPALAKHRAAANSAKETGLGSQAPPSKMKL